MDFSAPQGRKSGPCWILESHPGMVGGRVISPRGKSYPEGAPRGKNALWSLYVTTRFLTKKVSFENIFSKF